MIKAIFQFLANALGIWRQRDEAKNASDVKAAKTAQREQAEVDKTIKAVVEQDIDEERKAWSEN